MSEDSEKDGHVDRLTEIALFRHKLVQPVLAVAEEDRPRLIQELCSKRYRDHRKRLKRINPKTLRRWVKAFQKNGLEALKPKIRKDHGKSRTIPQVWVDQAIFLRSQVPSRSATTLIEILSRQPDCPTIRAQALNRVLKALGWSRAQAMKQPAPRRRRWQAEKVFDLVQGDATEGIYLPDPLSPAKVLKTKLILWIDDFSRLVPFAQFFFDEKLPRMEHTLKMAILRRGRMARVYVDNGSIFRAKQFKATLADLEIRKHHSRAYTPQGRGKVERIFGVIQQQLYPELIAEKITSLEVLNESLWAWLERVYHVRVHSETGQAPIDLYRSQLSQIPQADPVRVQRAFLWRFIRKVTGNGFIKLLGNQYSVDPQWSGRHLELRLDPYDLSQVFVYENKQPIGKATIKLQKKQRMLEIERTLPPPPAADFGISFLSLLRQEYRQQRQREIEAISFRKVEADQ